MPPSKKLKPEHYISIASAVVALTALGVSIWQGYETRKHNRLSVTPNLVYYTQFSPTDKLQGFNITNNGLGPAIIDNFTIYVDDYLVNTQAASTWLEVIDKLELDRSWITYNWLEPGYAIRPDETVWLIAISETDQTVENINLLKNVLPRLRIQIEYHSIYEDPFSTDLSPIFIP